VTPCKRIAFRAAARARRHSRYDPSVLAAAGITHHHLALGERCADTRRRRALLRPGRVQVDARRRALRDGPGPHRHARCSLQ
jgi:hypothetical protein